MTGPVLTFLSSGSLLTKFLEKNEVQYETESIPGALRKFKEQARELLSLESIPALEKVSYSYSKQNSYLVSSKEAKTTATALKNLKQRRLTNVDPNNILLTCSKGAWYKKTRRGTLTKQNQERSQKKAVSSARSTGSPTQLGAPISTITALT